MDKQKLSDMSGEKMSGGAPKLVLNQIRFNGKKGVYLYENVKGGLIEKDGKKQYEKKSLGNQIEVVFLKIRRKLYQFRKDKKALSTNEHNHPGARVTLFGGDKPENGIASELREKYPLLRTNQVVYALYNGEMVRMIVKGASLGSKTKPKDVDDFYSYISKFQGKNDEHFYEFKTVLTSGEESGDLGEYWVMHFAKGDKVEDMDAVEKNMEIAFKHCEEADAHYLQRMTSTMQKPEKAVAVEEEGEEEYSDEEDINPEDIPF